MEAIQPHSQNKIFNSRTQLNSTHEFRVVRHNNSLKNVTNNITQKVSRVFLFFIKITFNKFQIFKSMRCG